MKSVSLLIRCLCCQLFNRTGDMIFFGLKKKAMKKFYFLSKIVHNFLITFNGKLLNNGKKI